MLWLRDIWHRSAPRLVACNENAPDENAAEGDAGVLARMPRAEAPDVRALATGAALATALDASPAVLVSIYDYAHRYRDRSRRSA
jgi:hypothetical protein